MRGTGTTAVVPGNPGGPAPASGTPAIQGPTSPDGANVPAKAPVPVPVDLGRELARIAAIPQTRMRDEAAGGLAEVIPLADASAALDEARRRLPAMTLPVFADRLLRRLAEERPLEALALVDRFRGDSLDWLLRAAVLDTWAGRDPSALVRWFEGLPDGPQRSRLVGDVGAALGMQAPREGMELFKRLSKVGGKDEFLSDFLAAWGQRDAPAAAMAVRDHAFTPGREHVLGSLVATWGRRDLAAATAFLQGLPPGPTTREVWQAAVGEMATYQPRAAADLALRAGRAADRAGLVDSVARAWAELEPVAAVAWAETLTDPVLRRAALAVSLPQLAAEDPTRALEITLKQGVGRENEAIFRVLGESMRDRPGEVLKWLDGLPGKEARGAAFSGFLSKLAESDPAGAAAFAGTLPPGAHRTQALSTVGAALAQSDPGGALAWLKGLGSGQERAAAAQSMIWEFGRSHPEQGLELLGLLPEGADRQQLHATLASAWAEHDLEGAVKWARNAPPGPGRDTALDSIASTWAMADPAAAAEFAASLAPGSGPENFAATVAATWAQTDPAAAAAWAKGLESPERVQAVLGGVLRQWAGESPEAAFAFAASVEDETVRRAASLAAFEGAVELDPRGAAARLGQLDEGETRVAAAATLVGAWAVDDPAGASGWLATQPEALRSDEAVAALAGALVEYEPNKALAWAASIGDEDLRRQHTQRLARQWMQSSPEQALEWMKQSGMDPADIEAIREGGEAPVRGRKVIFGL